MPYYPPSNGTTTVVTTNTPAEKKVNAQTGTSYALRKEDANSLITLDNSRPITVNIPDDAVQLPLGVSVELMQLGTGAVTVSAANGVALKSASDQFVLKGPYAVVTLRKTAPQAWVITGDLAEPTPST